MADSRQEAVRQATLAKQVLDHESYQQAFGTIKQLLQERLWLQCSAEDGGKPSERLCAMVWAVQQVENVFSILVSGGTIAQAELEMEANAKAKAENALKRIRDYG